MAFTLFHRKKTQAAHERKARFQQVISLAQDIADIDPGGLVALVRLIAAPLQARTITYAAHSQAHSVPYRDSFNMLFFRDSLPVTPDGRSTRDLAAQCPDRRHRLRLGVDPVLAVPWQRDRLANALATIGFGKLQGAWSEDSNHVVTLLFPMGMGIVIGGNHSIATGIANGEGYVTSKYVQDVTPLYEHVQYDGCAFLRSCDNSVLSQPQDEETGTLFEIGRLMAEYGVAPGVERIDSDSAPAPSLASGDGYYKVLIDGQDAGVALTPSGAALALRKAGYQEGSIQMRQALYGESSFVRRN